MDIMNYVGYGLLAFAAATFLWENRAKILSKFSSSKIDFPLIQEDISDLKCFKDFVKTLDAKKDKERIESLLKEFGPRLIKDYVDEK